MKRLCAATLAIAALTPIAAFAQYAPSSGQAPQLYGRVDLSVNSLDVGGRGHVNTVSSDTSLFRIS